MTLTVADLRQHVTSALLDPALQRELDAAYQAVDHRVGTTAAAVESHRAGSGPLLMLNRAAASISAVTEDATGVPVVLNAADYALRPSGSLLERLTTGPNPRSRWYGRVDVTVVPRVLIAERDRVAIDLVRNYLEFHPGVSSERIGEWQESFEGAGDESGYAARREEILATLDADAVGAY